MSATTFQLIILAVVVGLGAIVIRWVRTLRPDIDRYLKTSNDSPMRRVVYANLGRMSPFDVLRALVLGALALWIGTYLGWVKW